MYFTYNRGLSRCHISRYWGVPQVIVTPKLASLRLAAINVAHPWLTSMLLDLISVGKRAHSSHAEWRYSLLSLITRNTSWYVQEWLTYYLVSSEIYLPCREEPVIAFWWQLIQGVKRPKKRMSKYLNWFIVGLIDLSLLGKFANIPTFDTAGPGYIVIRSFYLSHDSPRYHAGYGRSQMRADVTM